MQDKKPDLSFFHVFGALCYHTNDNDDLGKLDAKADIGIFVGYAPAKKAFRIYNKRTRKIIETIHVTFDELTAMASEQFSSGLGLHYITPVTSSSGLVPNPIPQQSFQEAATPRAVVLADSPVLTSIDQDAPLSCTHRNRNNKKQSQTFSQGFEESPKTPIFRDDYLMNLLMKNQLLKGHHRIFLISEHFSKGAVDPTLFTWHAGNDLLLNVILLGLQISQSPRGIFINQSKYASEIVKKYGMLTTDSVDTPLVEKSKLDEDLQGKQVDATLYRGMIGSLMYLTSSRPDLIHAVCLCARYQAKPTKKHLQAEQVENGIVELYFVRTEYQLADIFTKPLPRERFNFLIEKLSMRSMSLKTLKRLEEETDE
ncbi:retrovirus-related pol polyprotein from transposon TNT 1-94 [Tanacetum coccineum]